MKKLDKLFLRLAKDTLQLYHAATGKSKFDLANKTALIGATIEICCFIIMSISIAIIGFYILSGLFLLGILMALLNLKMTRKECSDLEILEKRAKESGLMVPPYIYDSFQRQGRFSAIFGPIFMVIPPYGISTILFFGIFLRGLSYYILMIEDLPSGKNIFEKIKDKVKSINLVPATLKPVKVNGR